METLSQKKVSQGFIVGRYLNNKDYFSSGNKRWFNIEKIECYEMGNSFGVVIEHQGEFMTGSSGKHVVLKLVSHDRNICTISNGWKPNKNGLFLYRDIRDFLKSELSDFEKNVLSKLNTIRMATDNNETIEFISFDGNGFRLNFSEKVEIIDHIFKAE